MKKMFVIAMGLALVIFTGVIVGVFTGNDISREEIPAYTETEVAAMFVEQTEEVDGVEIELLDNSTADYICYAAYVDGDLIQIGSVDRAYAMQVITSENS